MVANPKPQEAPRLPLNLALQGGGAHGAFTWGVLDRLLDDGRFTFDRVSGTSAGAVNAVALAAGLAEGGNEGARRKLANIWQGVGNGFDPLRVRERSGQDPQTPPDYDGRAVHMMLDMMTRVYSPYDLDIFNYDPLRDLLEREIDFERLRKRSPVKLIIAATDIATGKPRFFREKDLTVDTVLASACLPTLRKAVPIDDQLYWDGGFSSNPPLLPLIRDGRTDDTLLVKLNPTLRDGVPMKAQDIVARANQLTFSRPLFAEIETIEAIRRQNRSRGLLASSEARRVGRHRFHMIDAGDYTGKLAHGTKLAPDWNLLDHLHDGGQRAAGEWLDGDAKTVGRRSSLNLASLVG